MRNAQRSGGAGFCSVRGSVGAFTFPLVVVVRASIPSARPGFLTAFVPSRAFVEVRRRFRVKRRPESRTDVRVRSARTVLQRRICGASRGTSLRESSPCCQIFPFFSLSLSFFPVAIAEPRAQRGGRHEPWLLFTRVFFFFVFSSGPKANQGSRSGHGLADESSRRRWHLSRALWCPVLVGRRCRSSSQGDSKTF